MRTIEKSDVEILIPHARKALQGFTRAGITPDKVLWSADDMSIGGLSAAHVNWEQLRKSGVGDVSPCWCECNPEPDQVYFRNINTGSHGWMCSKCLGMTQSG